ncbi:MAG TPA: ferritin family protein [Patescibacteria group bacterium]|nr:ferritin family protein [Patescibacteria group bacterium]
MNPVEALEMALHKEESSIQMYENLSRQHPAIKELLLFLLVEEQKHKQLIAKKISEIS